MRAKKSVSAKSEFTAIRKSTNRVECAEAAAAAIVASRSVAKCDATFHRENYYMSAAYQLGRMTRTMQQVLAAMTAAGWGDWETFNDACEVAHLTIWASQPA